LEVPSKITLEIPFCQQPQIPICNTTAHT
jgi:hypothetical protein